MNVRAATTADATGIVYVHFAAVHHTAAPFYPPEVLDNWSRPPDATRYQQVRDAMTKGDELFIVAEDSLQVIGFGSVVPSLLELRAVYVHPEAGRRGVGSRILVELERLAAGRGVSRLHMDASVNAEAFYRKAGYHVVEHGAHRLSSGHEMACVKMKKDLAW